MANPCSTSWTVRAAIRRTLPALLVLFIPACLGAAPLRFDPARMIPVDEIKEGMKGVARTVFTGDKIEEFDVEVLGVIRHSSSDGDLILVHCLGDRLAHTGIAAGMSGSPVYLGGRLAGAIALGWPFSKDAIAGVTPIEQMIRVTEVTDSSRRRELEVESPRSGERMTPLPLLARLSGRSPQLEALADSLVPELRGRVHFMDGGSAGTLPGRGSAADLVPGAAMGIGLVRGDLEMAAVGTVTWRDGDQVLCFGHPLFSAGSISLPLTTAYVHTILSSELSSFKVASTGAVVGALTEDRTYAVRGHLGEAADQIPVTLELSDEDGLRRDYHYFVARHHGLAPSLVGLALADALSSTAGGIGRLSMPYSAVIHFAGGRTLRWQDQPATTPNASPATDIARDVSARLSFLMNNPWHEERVDSVRVVARIDAGSRWVSLESAWIESGRVRAGQRLGVGARLRSDRGGTFVETFTIDLPRHMPAGRYKLVVGDADARFEAERLRAPGALRAQSLEQGLELLSIRGTHAAIYAVLYSEDTGFSARGRELPALPGAAMAAMEESRQSGGVQAVKARRWAEAVKYMAQTVVGAMELNFNVESEAP